MAPEDAPIPLWNKDAPRQCPERRARYRRLSGLRPRCRPWPPGEPGSSPRARSRTASRRPSAYISITAPVVSEARKVMIAMTATSARPPIESDGTIARLVRRQRLRAARAAASRGQSGFVDRPWFSILALNRNRRDRGRSTCIRHVTILTQPALVKHETRRIELIHQRDIMRRDHDRGAGFVQLDEQPQQPLRQFGIDVSRRFVGKQELRPRDHRARDGRALLLAAGQDRRQRRHPLAQARPIAEARSPRCGRSPRRVPARGTAARHSRRWSCDRAGGSPGTRRRRAAARSRRHLCESRATS